MTVTTEDISLGVCDATFKGIDLGATKGGVEIQIQTSTYEVKSDQTGESPLKDVIIGTVVIVKVPMLETNLDKLASVMPQAVAMPASGSVPTGFTTPAAAVGATSMVLPAGGTGNPAVGMTFKCENHATIYRVTGWTAGTRTLAFVQHEKGEGGLVAPVDSADTLTFYQKNAGVEVRAGVNTDLFAGAGQLVLHPTGVSPGETREDFTAFKAAPVPNFTFKYETGGERVYEVEFKCYPDTANNNRIAAFGAVS